MDISGDRTEKIKQLILIVYRRLLKDESLEIEDIDCKSQAGKWNFLALGRFKSGEQFCAQVFRGTVVRHHEQIVREGFTILADFDHDTSEDVASSHVGWKASCEIRDGTVTLTSLRPNDDSEGFTVRVRRAH